MSSGHWQTGRSWQTQLSGACKPNSRTTLNAMASLSYPGMLKVQDARVPADLIEGACQANQWSPDQGVDAIRDQFGGQSIRRAGVLRQETLT
jgi:hypothetical protein